MEETLEIKRFDYDIDTFSYNIDMSNKLFCTFATEDTLDGVLEEIKSRYKIIYSKIFVLYSKSQNEYICTYNVDFGNVSNFIDNTILVHRKKESNTLYTINALNTLIKELNNGQLDTSFKVNWTDYRNCILLTKGSELKRVRQSIKNRDRNKHYKTLLSTVSKKVKNATKENAEEMYSSAAKVIDKIASKGIIHKKHSFQERRYRKQRETINKSMRKAEPFCPITDAI